MAPLYGWNILISHYGRNLRLFSRRITTDNRLLWDYAKTLFREPFPPLHVREKKERSERRCCFRESFERIWKNLEFIFAER